MIDQNPFHAPSSSIAPPPPVRARSAAGIHGTDQMSDEELAKELEAGGRFVAFDYCVSYFIMTHLKMSKDVYFVRPGEWAALRGMRWNLLSLVAGWWCFPWGPVSTPIAIFTNLCGGHDVTAHVVQTALRWEEKKVVEQFIERGSAPISPKDGDVPDALTQIRF